MTVSRMMTMLTIKTVMYSGKGCTVVGVVRGLCDEVLTETTFRGPIVHASAIAETSLDVEEH